MIIFFSPFLWIGVILPFFHWDGNVLLFNALQKMVTRGVTMASSQIFNILIESPSCPWNLFGSNEQISFNISVDWIFKVVSKNRWLVEGKFGNTLELS